MFRMHVPSILLVMIIVCIIYKRFFVPSIHPSCSFVINMTHNTERYDRFTHKYNESDINHVPLHRFEAVDGKSLNLQSIVKPDVWDDLQEVIATGKRRSDPQLTPGAVGCYLSHKNIWQYCHRTNVIIFEDDADIPPYTYDQISTLLKQLHGKDWDILLLGFVSNQRSSTSMVRIKRFFCTHAYIVRDPQNLHKKVSNAIPRPAQQIDSDLSDLSEKGIINVYGYGPGDLISQTYETPSDIQTPFFDKDN